MSALPAPSGIELGQRRWLFVTFALVLLLQLELVFNRPVNWDEFLHLSETHAFGQGRLTEVLQVFYARVFFWLPMLAADAIDQIRIARMFMMGFELFTLLAIYAMARRFAGHVPAALAALAYLTGGYVFQHGFSYRADPMAAAFLMGALWILLASRLDTKAILGAALLAGLAVLTTIKVIFYAPAFAAIAWLRWRESTEPRVIMLRLAAFVAAALLFAFLFLGATIASLPDVGHANATKTVTMSGTMMFGEGLFPNWGYALRAALMAPFLAALLLLTPFALARSGLSQPRRWALAAMLLPLASILLYRNAFPYYYVFILPPAMVALAVTVRQEAMRFSVPALCVALFANALIVSLATPREVLRTQQQVLGAVHEIFPEPVAYFDFPGMVPAFPKANFFMSTWGARKYRDGHEASFVDAMARETVPLLILNKESIERNQTGAMPAREFLPADAKALREGFIAHWGPIWVAGHRFPANHAMEDFTIYAPGAYTIEGATMRIDGRDYIPGGIATLTRGVHRFERLSEGEAALRWGRHLEQPSEPFSGGLLFKDF